MINTACLKLFEKENPPQAKVYWHVWYQVRLQVCDKVQDQVRLRVWLKVFR